MKKALLASTVILAAMTLGGCNETTTKNTTSTASPAATQAAASATGICQQYFDLVKKCTASMDKTYADQYAQSMKMVEQQITSMPKEQADQICKMSLDASKTAFANMGCK